MLPVIDVVDVEFSIGGVEGAPRLMAQPQFTQDAEKGKSDLDERFQWDFCEPVGSEEDFIPGATTEGGAGGGTTEVVMKGGDEPPGGPDDEERAGD